MSWHIYKIIDPRDRTIFYIGITENLVERFRQHRSDPSSAAFNRIRGLRDIGFEAEMSSVATAETKEAAMDFEAYLISKTPGLVNRQAPYGKHPDPTPTANPVWPHLGVNELTYEAEEESDEEKRIHRLYESLGGTVAEGDIRKILTALDVLSHEDSEYTALTDE